MSTDKRTIDWYNKNAKNYSDHVKNPNDSIYHSLYEKPAMYSELPELTGMSVISLGCGTGEDSNYLFSKGAKHSVGIDISTELIKLAQSTYPNCEFIQMDMEKLDFPDESFDFAYSSLAIHYIEDWSKVFSEVFRVLKPGTSFLFSCGHPVNSALEVTSNNDTQKIRQLGIITDKKVEKMQIIGDYLKRKRIESITDGFDVTTYHKSLSEISSEATKAGFLIESLIEPKPLESMKTISPNDYLKLNKIPNFVIFKLLKQ